MFLYSRFEGPFLHVLVGTWSVFFLCFSRLQKYVFLPQVQFDTLSRSLSLCPCLLLSQVTLITSSPSHVNKSSFQEYSNSSATLELYSWTSFHPNTTIISNYSFYQSLYENDRVRANFIRKRTMKLKPDVHEEQIQVPVRSALPLTGATYYFVRLMVGTPPREFFFVMDTGSGITWIQCYRCTSCFVQRDMPLYGHPLYPSSSGITLGIEDSRCQMLGDPTDDGIGRCMYHIEYGSTPVASSRGPLIEESLKVGDLTHRSYIMGCGIENVGTNGEATGVFGLNQGNLSFLRQVGFQSFSFCITGRRSSEPGSLVFGVTIPNEAVIGKLVNPNDIDDYYINLRAISVDNTKLDLNPTVFNLHGDGLSGGVIVDLGSTVTTLYPIVIAQLLATFDKKMTETFGDSFIRYKPRDSFVCYNMQEQVSVSRFPRVGFHLGEGQEERVWLLPFQALMFENYKDEYCFAFVELEHPKGPQIIGNIALQNTRIYFDLQNKRFGVLVDAC